MAYSNIVLWFNEIYPTQAKTNKESSSTAHKTNLKEPFISKPVIVGER